MTFLKGLLRYPIIQAPMAGGPSCPKLASVVSEAGGMGFLAAGYKTNDEMEKEISEVKQLTKKLFGVNVFVPQKSEIDSPVLSSYIDTLESEADRLGVSLGEAVWDDDCYDEKIEYLLANPVPVVSFTFGCPPNGLISKLQQRGSFVIITVTTPEEAEIAFKVEPDALCLQGVEAGGHRGSFDDKDVPGKDLSLLSLLSAVRSNIDLPLIVAGGIMHGRDIAAVIMSGAAVAQIGTAFLRCTESGTNQFQKSAMADPSFQHTMFTRAFSGRKARGIANRFMLEYNSAPSAYPQINNVTKPLRREAAARGDTGTMNMWAGQGFRFAEELPAAKIVERLVRECRQAFDEIKTKTHESII
ncbi:MAG: nitronate monooxygenase [Thaumarchaeota archaeon]|nr:nitronate monooxygenase [Nitrososphaerota archaeon]